MIRIYQVNSTINSLNKILYEGKYTIGRSVNCDIQITDDTVSREHAILEIDRNDNIKLTDLNSVNGTSVNDKKITGNIPIDENDEIRFGDIDIRIIRVLSSGGEDASVIIDEKKRSPSTTKIRIDSAINDVEQNVLYTPKVFWALSEMGRMLVHADSPELLYNKTLELVKDAIPSQRIALLLAKSDRESVSVVASKITDDNLSKEFVVSRTVIKELLTQKVAVLISDVKASEKFSSQQSIISSNISSAMAMPLLDDDKVMGILYIDTTNIREQYTEDHLRIFATFGDILATKLKNQNLLKDKQQKAIIEAELKISKQLT
ncbi:MAG: FHA domain-containing protein, partial [Candidatus Zixiibacteriota bacterium]